MNMVWWCDFSARFTWCSLRWFCPEIQHDLVMNQKQNPSTKTRITDRLYSLQWTSMKQMKHPVARKDEWILTIMDDGDQMDWTMSTNQSGDDSGQCRKNWTFRDLEQRTSHQLPVQMKVILDLYSDDGVVVFEVETDVAISEKCVWWKSWFRKDGTV